MDGDYCIFRPSMAQQPTPPHRRLAVYSYLRPLLEGRRVLEVGSGSGDGAAHLLALGARTVFGTDEDGAALDAARRKLARTGLTFVPRTAVREGGPFDVVVVPEATALLRGADRLSLATLREVLGSSGRLVCLVRNGDLGNGASQDGLSYYDVVDALAPHFPRVRMFGQTPFAAFGIAEFDDATGGLQVDSGLVAESGEQPDHYLAVAGPEDSIPLGYALVQVPLGTFGAAPAPSPAAAPAADGSVAELRRKLAEAQGAAEAGGRVSRRARRGGEPAAPGPGRQQRVGHEPHPAHDRGDDVAGPAADRGAARRAARGGPPDRGPGREAARARGGPGRARIGALRSRRPHRRSRGRAAGSVLAPRRCRGRPAPRRWP